MELTLKNGEILTFRKLNISDYDNVNKFLERIATETPNTNQYVGQPPKNYADCEKIYASEQYLFLGVFNATNELVGSCSIGINKPNHPYMGLNSSFGISVLKAYYGCGIGSVFMDEMEKWAREKKMHRIQGEVRAENRRAISLYIKHGFSIEGCAKETAWINGKWMDSYYIGKILK